MKKHYEHFFLAIIIVVSMLSMAYCIKRQAECEARGGVLVRAVAGYGCVEEKR